jgi:hypothetical protein
MVVNAIDNGESMAGKVLSYYRLFAIRITIRSSFTTMSVFIVALAFFLKPLQRSIALVNGLFLPRCFLGDSTRGVAYGMMITFLPIL